MIHVEYKCPAGVVPILGTTEGPSNYNQSAGHIGKPDRIDRTALTYNYILIALCCNQLHMDWTV